jgi:hypothetical protein
MTGQPQEPPPDGPAGPARFEATVHPREDTGVELAMVADLDLDRVPDPEGGVRVLVNMEEVAHLVEQGFEVRLERPVPVRPLDPGMVASDEDVRAWFEERVRPTGREVP